MLVSGHTLLRDDTAPAARAALDAADAPLVAVVAAASALIGDEFHERAHGANVLLANEEEAWALTGLLGRDAAVELAERYELVVVTAGAGGAVAAYQGEVVVARPIEAVAGLAVGRGRRVRRCPARLARGGRRPAGGAGRRPCEAGRRALQL